MTGLKQADICPPWYEYSYIVQDSSRITVCTESRNTNNEISYIYQGLVAWYEYAHCKGKYILVLGGATSRTSMISRVKGCQ